MNYNQFLDICFLEGVDRAYIQALESDVPKSTLNVWMDMDSSSLYIPPINVFNELNPLC
jgi:hypothetical protein